MSTPDEKDHPTKEQRMELVRHRLISAELIPDLSRQQADKIIRRARFRRMRKATVKSLLILILLGLIGAGGYWGWTHKEQLKGYLAFILPEEAEEQVKQPEAEAKLEADIAADTASATVETETVQISFGSWNRWITEPRIIVLKNLPSQTRRLLVKQNQLLQSVLGGSREKEASPNQPSFTEQFESLKEEFPSGRNVRAGYSTTRSTRHTSSADGYASVSGNSSYTSYGGQKGVLRSYLDRYGTLINQLREDLASDQIESLRERVDRDIEDIEDRTAGNNSSLSAQNTATLRWLRSDVRPYLEKFQRFLDGPSESSGSKNEALEEWKEFEQSGKPAIEQAVTSLAVSQFPLDGDTFEAPPNRVVLLRATVGSRSIIFLPGPGSEITVQ